MVGSEGRGGWGTFLEQLPAGDRGYRTITRADLLDTATCHGLPQSLLAGYVWGPVARRSSSGAAHGVPGQRLAACGRGPARGRRYAAAWPHRRGLHRDAAGHQHYLKHLGPSFFTKFLYAADACDRQPGRALILDQFVAVALKAVDGWGISRYGPWDPSTYAKWIDHAHRVAAAEGVRADAVEMAYFNHGRKVAARR